MCLLRSVGGRPARMGGVKTPVGGGDATPTLPCIFRTAPGQFRLSRLGIVKNSPACATQCAMAPARLGDFKSNQKKERRNYGHGNECARRRHCGVGACTTQHSCRGGGARSAAQVGRAHGLTLTLTIAPYSSYVHYSACCPAAGGPAPLGSNRPSSPGPGHGHGHGTPRVIIPLVVVHHQRRPRAPSCAPVALRCGAPHLRPCARIATPLSDRARGTYGTTPSVFCGGWSACRASATRRNHRSGLSRLTNACL